MMRSRVIAACLTMPAITAMVLLVMGRPAICRCGHIEFWHGAIDAGTSQHVFDWYSASHIVHGLIFYALGHVLLSRRALGLRLIAALAIECAWEIVENSPMVIDRYRTATAALGYTGDSVLNSLSDIACMVIGFAIASRLPWYASLCLATLLEIVALVVIRDNLTLNVLMLLWPIPSIRAWQGQL